MSIALLYATHRIIHIHSCYCMLYRLYEIYMVLFRALWQYIWNCLEDFVAFAAAIHNCDICICLYNHTTWRLSALQWP
jgi:hypothetical protein